MGEQPEPGSDRVTVSMPRGYKAALEARVEAGEATSVSAFVADAVKERLARGSLHERIMALRGGRPFDTQALEWACRAVGATAEQADMVRARLGNGPASDQVAS